MHNGIRGIRRKAGVAGIAALTGLAGLLPLAAPAHAVPSATPTISAINDVTGAADPLDLPQIAPDSTGPARGWQITVPPGETFGENDDITIDVFDANGDPTIAFAEVPTVTFNGEPVTSVDIDTATGSPAGSDNRLEIQLDLDDDSYGTLKITGVQYDVAEDADRGYVIVDADVDGVTPAVGGADALINGSGTASNAWVSGVVVEYNDPEVGLKDDATNVTLSPIVIREANDDALARELGAADPTPATYPVDICVSLVDADPVTSFTSNSVDADQAGTVTVTSGDATIVKPATLDGTYVYFTVDVDPDASEFTLENLRVDADGTGVQAFVVTAAPSTSLDTRECDGSEQLSPELSLTSSSWVDRLGGSDRFATASIIAEDGWGTSNNVIIARGDDFADALASSYLSREVDGPILLVRPNEVPSQTLNALRTLEAKNVYIVGGTAAVSQGVAEQLDDTPSYVGGSADYGCGADSDQLCTLVVFRIAGANRYETAREVVDYAGTVGEIDLDPSDGISASETLRTAFLARGDQFADALAAGPLAYAGGQAFGVNAYREPHPILLTETAALSPAARDAILDNNIEQVVVLGGTAAVSNAVVSALEAMDVKVIRVAGANRQETAGRLMALAIKGGNEGGFGFDDDLDPTTPTQFALARGDLFPDALTLGPWAGMFEAPILLTESTNTLGLFTTAILDAAAIAFDGFTVAGGTDAVKDTVVQAALNAKVGTTIEP